MLSVTKPESIADWDDIRRICCDTGNNGSPIDQARYPFFGEYWVGPYKSIFPEWTYVAREDSGGFKKNIGYLTGCPDTKTLERSKLLRFYPQLLIRVALGRYKYNSDVKRFIKRSFLFNKGPEQSFPEKVLEILEERYPAHLHVNVLSGCRGSGAGSALVKRFAEDLRIKKIKGIHLFCGPDPVPFYKRNGFEEVFKIEFRPNVWVYVMGFDVKP